MISRLHIVRIIELGILGGIFIGRDATYVIHNIWRSLMSQIIVNIDLFNNDNPLPIIIYGDIHETTEAHCKERHINH